MLDTTQITNAEVENIRMSDYPDFVDAYISRAFWKDGRELDEKEIDQLNENGEYVYEQVLKWLY